MNAERKGKRGGRRGKARSLVPQRGRFVVRGKRAKWVGRVYLSQNRYTPNRHPIHQSSMLPNNARKNIEWALFPPTPHSKLVRYDSVFFVGTVLGPGVSQTVETRGLARSASPKRKRRTRRQSDIEAGSRPDSPSHSLISMASTARSKGLSALK